MVREGFTILVADRNRHISEFLQRELAAEGYRIELANDGRTVLTLMNKQSPDLLVLDLEIPYIDGIEILEKLQNEKCQIPVIVHTLLTQYANYPVVKRAAAFLEKQGSNIVGLKEMIFEVLRHYYPERFPPSQANKNN